MAAPALAALGDDCLRRDCLCRGRAVRPKGRRLPVSHGCDGGACVRDRYDKLALAVDERHTSRRWAGSMGG